MKNNGVAKIASNLKAQGLITKQSEDVLLYKERCKSESDEAYTIICKNQEEYDKQLLNLSIGMLAVLFAFLKDLVHLDSSVHRWLLYLTFASFGLTILVVLASFQLSIKALEEVREFWKRQFEGDVESAFPDKLANSVSYLNRLAGILFLFGIMFAIVFISTNLSHQAYKEEQMSRTDLQEGSTLKAPLLKPSEERGSPSKAPIQSAPKVPDQIAPKKK